MLKPRVPYIGEERRHQMRVKRFMKNFDYYVEGVTTKEQRNPYQYSRDDGRSYCEPMVLMVNVSGYVIQKTWPNGGSGQRAYFTHRINFNRYTGLWNGDYYDKTDTDFVFIENQKTRVLESGRPDLFPNAFALAHENNIRLKIAPGDMLRLRALFEERTSKGGSHYLQLSRVQINPESRI